MSQIEPNVGKETIALDLKDPRGQELLLRIIKELNVDIFCCNTLPGRYESLGIDYATLKTANPKIIWAGISAMGPEYPFVPGYDPALQAMSGFIELTGREPRDSPTPWFPDDARFEGMASASNFRGFISLLGTRARI